MLNFLSYIYFLLILIVKLFILLIILIVVFECYLAFIYYCFVIKENPFKNDNLGKLINQIIYAIHHRLYMEFNFQKAFIENKILKLKVLFKIWKDKISKK